MIYQIFYSEEPEDDVVISKVKVSDRWHCLVTQEQLDKAVGHSKWSQVKTSLTNNGEPLHTYWGWKDHLTKDDGGFAMREIV